MFVIGYYMLIITLVFKIKNLAEEKSVRFFV